MKIDLWPSAEYSIKIFNQAITDYHVKDHVITEMENHYPKDHISHLLYLKTWIDTVQWHLEDIIRIPEIDPNKGMAIKRRIDASNQHRTNVVEKLDDWFLDFFKHIKPNRDASLNTESPAWVLDRMSILCLKIYHMHEQLQRTDADDNHLMRCEMKLHVLREQEKDLSQAYNQLLTDISEGRKYMKVYRQMKMYNDESLNPALYQKKN